MQRRRKLTANKMINLKAGDKVHFAHNDKEVFTIKSTKIERRMNGVRMVELKELGGHFNFSLFIKIKPMRHVQKALTAMEGPAKEFILIENVSDVKGVPPVVSFTIQSDPVGEVGVNGCQATDMLEYVHNMFVSLNDSHSCAENEETIIALKTAMQAQENRTKDRIKRGVEGKSTK